MIGEQLEITNGSIWEIENRLEERFSTHRVNVDFVTHPSEDYIKIKAQVDEDEAKVIVNPRGVTPAVVADVLAEKIKEQRAANLQQTCNKRATDLISRQAAIGAIERLVLPQTKGETMAEEINRVAWRCAINCAEEMIGHLPTIEAEPIKWGKWIKNDGKIGWHCSMCQEDDLYAFSWNSDTGRYDFQDRYCPHCGAKMEPISASPENGQEVEE